MVGKVKEVKDTVKSEDMGRSEGWILGKDGFHRADPKWVGDRSETQPPSNNCGPTLVKKLPKSDRAGQVVDRPAPAKARKAKNKAAKASVGRSTYIKQATTNVGQVGELASTLASMKRDGFALFPQGFNAKYKTTGGIDSTTLGLQVGGDGTTFKKQGQVVFLSLVAFFNGNYKIVVHRDSDLQNSFDVNQRQVAWLTQVKKQRFDDKPVVDLLKLQKALYTWGTRVPKPIGTKDHSNAKVNFPLGQ